MKEALQVNELRVSLRGGSDGSAIQIVRGISFDLLAGRRMGLVGESGCGKTTTLLAIAGLLPPTATVGGSVRINGEEQYSSSATVSAALRRRDVGVVFQGSMNALNPVRRVSYQIWEALRAEVRANRRSSEMRCLDLLELVGLPSRVARAYPHELSGGMRQRVCIAMALAAEPRLLLADEPTTALDTVVQARIMKLLDDLCRDLQLAAVIVSHDLRLAIDFCDTIAVMYAGEIVEYQTSARLRDTPRHPYTELLLAATPTVESTKDRIKSIPGAPPDLRKAIVGCPFHPRCPQCRELCVTVSPSTVHSSNGSPACHFPLR